MSYVVPEWIEVFTNAPGLSDEDILKPLYMVSAFGRCKLCEEQVGTGEKQIAKHVRMHRRELEQYRALRRREIERDGTARLRDINREKKLAREAEHTNEPQEDDES